MAWVQYLLDTASTAHAAASLPRSTCHSAAVHCSSGTTNGLALSPFPDPHTQVSDLAAAQKLHYLASRLTYNAQKLCVSADAPTAATAAAT